MTLNLCMLYVACLLALLAPAVEQGQGFSR